MADLIVGVEFLLQYLHSEELSEWVSKISTKAIWNTLWSWRWIKLEKFSLPEDVKLDISFQIAAVLAIVKDESKIKEITEQLDLEKDFTEEDLEVI